MANTTVSVANVPDELVRDILKMYAEHFEELKSQNKNDYSALMQTYADNWDQDVSYGNFNMSRLDGPFLSRIILTQRAKYKKVYNIRHTGSGYAAACAKYTFWQEAFDVFSKKSEFSRDSAIQSEAPTTTSTPSTDIIDEEDTQTAPKLTPAGAKRAAQADAKLKKAKLFDSTLHAHQEFAALSQSFQSVNKLVEENQRLQNMKLRRDLGLDIINFEQPPQTQDQNNANEQQ